MNTNKKSVILLSGGLDSVVSLACLKESHNIQLALTFDYGQRAKYNEISASEAIASYYNVEHRVVNLSWLASITKTALVNTSNNLPKLDMAELDEKNATETSAQNVWVPNRNGLFINIAASFADTFKFTHIIFGANKEEGTTFPDNSPEFIKEINDALKYSTMVQPEVISPLIALTKKETVELAIEKKVPLHLIRSCYTNNKTHCGVCESCLRLKRALELTGQQELIIQLFGEK